MRDLDGRKSSLARVTGVVLVAMAVAACRPASPGRSKLWSVRTADDFARLVQNGRGVADVPTSEADTRLALANGLSLGGISAVNIEMDESNEAVVYAEFDTRQTPAVHRAAVESFTRDLLNRASADLRIQPNELKPYAMPAARSSQFAVAFTREISGVPVRDSRIVFIYGADSAGQYHLMEVDNRTWSHIRPMERPSGARLTDAKISQVIRSKNSRILTATDGYQIDRRSQKPRLVPTTWYDVISEDGLRYTLSFSGGDEPDLIEAYSHRFDVTLEANTFIRNWNGPRQYYALPDVTVEGPSGQKTLDGDGTITDGMTSGKVILRSNWARFYSEAGNPTTYDIVSEGGRTVAKIEGNGGDSAINAYVALTRVRAFVMKFLSPSDLPFLRKTFRVTTDIADSCNAYYQGLTISLFGRGEGCANMALVNDVIYHEWGHGLDDYTGPGAAMYGGGMSDGAFSEGIGDILAMFMNHDYNMGVGFFTSDATKPIRRLENKKVYVPGQSSPIHSQGTIIGGAFWELRKRMINKYGDAGHDKAAGLFFAHLREADSYLDSYKIVQRLADDDNNTVTRHSDWCMINHAFAIKGLTKEDPCQDDYATPSAGAESKIFFAISDPSSSGATPLFVSSTLDGAQSVKICPGRESCGNAVTAMLSRTESGVSFFGPSNWNVGDGGVFNAQVLDAGGRELGRRIAKFTKK